MSLKAWNITISPDTSPILAWRDGVQINPYVKITLLNDLYLPQRKNRVSPYFNASITLSTAFNTKSFYTQ